MKIGYAGLSLKTERRRDESSGTESGTKDCKDGYRKDPILKVRIEIQTVRQGIMTMNKEARDNYLLPPSIPGKNNNYQ